MNSGTAGCIAATTNDISGHHKGCVGFAAMLQKQHLAEMDPQGSMPYIILGLFQLCDGSFTDKLFSFRVYCLTDIFCLCYGICFPFQVLMWLQVTPMVAQ